MKTLARILLVEDDPADTRLVLEALSKLGLDWQTLALPDGIVALDWLHGRGRFQDRPPGQPVVILLDVKMPGMNGLEVLGSIRSDSALRLIPVVMLSGSSLERDVRGAYELGACGFLVKPIDYSAGCANLHAFGLFFAMANQPPPGCLGPPRLS